MSQRFKVLVATFLIFHLFTVSTFHFERNPGLYLTSLCLSSDTSLVSILDYVTERGQRWTRAGTEGFQCGSFVEGGDCHWAIIRRPTVQRYDDDNALSKNNDEIRILCLS